MSVTELAYAGLEEAINQRLALDPAAKERMGQLHGRVIALELRGFDTTLFFIPAPDRLQLLARHEGEPDCTLGGTPGTLLQMLQGTDKEGTAAIPKEVSLSGDRELAQRFVTILQTAEVNWERHLSRYTGELIAQEVGRLVRGGMAWGEHIADTLGEELRMMLQERNGALPSRDEVTAFLADVDRLRDRVERLERRINRISGNPDQGGSV
jgi:ubiquinone biosynthesis protein UbiJ